MTAPFTSFDPSYGERLLPVFEHAGVPSNGTTFAGVAKKGALCIDVTNGTLYQNTNTLASPTWTARSTVAGAMTPTTIAGTDATDASSSTTGAFKTAGGMGIAKKLYVGTALTVGTTLDVGGVASFAGMVKMASKNTALTAVGTDRAGSLILTTQFNNITTVGAATAGVTLPAASLGVPIFVWNNGANAMHVYAAGSDTIDGAAAATGVVLTNAKSAMYYPISGAAFVSMMGIPSA